MVASINAMKKKLPWIIIGSMISICIFFLFEYACFSLFIVNKGMFHSVVEEKNLEAALGIPSEQLKQVSDSMIDYVGLWKQDDSLQVIVTKDGTDKGFYTEKEIKHIEDVRVLMCNVKILVFIIIAIVALLLPIFLKKKKILELCYGYWLSLAMLIVIVLIIAIIAVVDINVFITLFHKLLFDNDDWLMNPAREKIIYFFPNSLYQEVLRRLLICTICYFIAATGFAVGYIRKRKKDCS